MSARQFHVVLLALTTLWLSGCQILQRDSFKLITLDYIAATPVPDYKPGHTYLPVAVDHRMQWFAKIREEVVPRLGLLVFWSDPASQATLVTREGLIQSYDDGKSPRLTFRNSCPQPQKLSQFSQTKCQLTSLTPLPGKLGLVQDMHYDRVIRTTYQLGNARKLGRLVPDSAALFGSDSSFYLYDADGDLVMSRQVLFGRVFDVLVPESAP